MNARVIGTTIAVVLAMACKTSGSQSSAGGSTQTSSSGTSTEQQGSQASSAGQEGSQPGATAQDPLMKPGPAIKGHSSDQVVSGAIGHVSPYSVSIVSDRGDTTTLEIVPQTTITVGGTDASSTDLAEGQPVRASFNEVDGQDVAVQIQVLSSGTSGGTGSASDQGTVPGDSSTGGSSAGGGGTGSGASDQGTAPDGSSTGGGSTAPDVPPSDGVR